MEEPLTPGEIVHVEVPIHETMTFHSILKRMSTPWVMMPREVVQSYMYLVSVHSQKTMEFLETDAKAAGYETKLLETMTSAKARTLLRASDEGKTAAMLKGELSALQEAIRALKRAQAYYADEARNLV